MQTADTTMMTLADVRDHLMRHGFRSIRTADGWLHIDEWRPYGACGSRLLFRRIDFRNHRIYEQVSTVGVAGVWEFTV